MEIKWEKWVSGAVSALIGGAAQAAGGYILVPANYDWAKNWHLVVIVCVFGALINLGLFIKQCPPPLEGNTDNTTTPTA